MIPILVAICWTFFYIPFFSIIPCALIILSIDREEYVTWERITYNSMAILFAFGIGLILFIIYLFFKRRDAERKFKFIASKVIKRLAKNHVKSDYYTIDMVYQQYVQDGPDKTRQTLKLNDPLDWIDHKEIIQDVELDAAIAK